MIYSIGVSTALPHESQAVQSVASSLRVFVIHDLGCDVSLASQTVSLVIVYGTHFLSSFSSSIVLCFPSDFV